MKEPERPGSVIPETPIIPHKKTNHRLLFSPAGVKKLIDKPKIAPDIKKLKVFATQVSDEINDEYDVARFADEEEYSPEAMLDYIKGWGEDNKLSAKQVIDEFDWTTLIMELGLGESVVNEAQTDNDYTFDNLQDYRKAVAALYNAGFYRSGNGNPPTGDETGTYQEDEHWLNLRIIDGEKDAAKVLKKTKLKYNAKYQKPTGYTVFNHGGHLD